MDLYTGSGPTRHQIHDISFLSLSPPFVKDTDPNFGPFWTGGWWDPTYNDWWARTYNEGTLIIDLVDAHTKRLVWRAYAQAEKNHEAPRDAWLLQCVQEDRSNPVPCTEDDRARWGRDGTKGAAAPLEPLPEPSHPVPVDTADAGTGSDMDDIFGAARFRWA